jgi:hypothetical protein
MIGLLGMEISRVEVRRGERGAVNVPILGATETVLNGRALYVGTAEPMPLYIKGAADPGM